MVVRGARELWVPAVPRHLKRVDLKARQVIVDWDDGAGWDYGTGQGGTG
jgi:ribosomal 30S subunit maturation factor RimM